jgi:molecular chaperone Hsp33
MSNCGENDITQVFCRFVRGHNALLCGADFGPMFMDCYLHLGQTGIVLADGADEKLKLLLAAVALHAAARPHAETIAWTLHLESEQMNLFAVAENPTGHVTGQVFSENVRSTGGNVLHAETAAPNIDRRRSLLEFSGHDILRAAEIYYQQSEQRPARYFDLGGDTFALLVAQPDCDLPWLESVGFDGVKALLADETRSPLEIRQYCFACGCTPERIAGAIGPSLQGALDEVFGSDRYIRVICPRCGARHEISRELFDAAPETD